VIARAIDLYIRQWKFDLALRLYGNGTVTALKAATLAGLSIWEFLEEVWQQVRRAMPLVPSALALSIVIMRAGSISVI